MKFIGLEETCSRLDVLPSWLYRHSHRLPNVRVAKVGKYIKFLESDIDRLIEYLAEGGVIDVSR